MTAHEIARIVMRDYDPDGRMYGNFAFLPELPNRRGFASDRFMDLAVVYTWDSERGRVDGYEIKASRSDFLRELKDPAKTDSLVRSCTMAWFAVAPGVYREGDVVPDMVGVKEVWESGEIKVLKKATLQKDGYRMGHEAVRTLQCMVRRGPQVKAILKYGDDEMSEEEIDRIIEERVRRMMEPIQKESAELAPLRDLRAAVNAHYGSRDPEALRRICRTALALATGVERATHLMEAASKELGAIASKIGGMVPPEESQDA